MLKLFLIENTNERVSYDYYFNGVISAENKGNVTYNKQTEQPKFALAETDINRTNASMVFSKIRQCIKNGEFPFETMIIWY